MVLVCSGLQWSHYMVPVLSEPESSPVFLLALSLLLLSDTIGNPDLELNELLMCLQCVS